MSQERAKQVVHSDAHQSFNSNIANEAERENWTEQTYARKNSNKDKNNHYDYSRRKLNFEINNKGEIIAQGSQKKNITERLNERLKELNFKFSYDRFGNLAANSQNCCIDFVVSGNRNVMRKLAFGEQQVDYSDENLGKANWNIKREKAIEDWAQKEYAFFSKKFGAQNVISFQVHLDETTPHAHILVVPVAQRRKFGRSSEYRRKDDADIRIKMKEYDSLSKDEKKGWEPANKELVEAVSYGRVVGRTWAQYKTWMENFHTQHYEEVGRYFGLERGDDLDLLSEEERLSRHHMSKTELKAFKEREEKRKKLDEEYERKRVKDRMLDVSIRNKSLTNDSLMQENSKLASRNDDLQKEIKKTTTKLKSLTTMRNNLQSDVEKIKKELEDLTPAQQRYKELTELLTLKEQKLQHRNEQIYEAQNKLDNLQNKYDSLQEDYLSLKEETSTLQQENESARKEKEETQKERVAHIAHVNNMYRERNKVNANQDSIVKNEVAALALHRVCDDISSSVESLKSSSAFLNLSDDERYHLSATLDSIFNTSTLKTFAENEQLTLSLAAGFFLGTIVPSDVASVGGGGGNTSDLRWDGRGEDESYEDFMSRCLGMSVKIINSNNNRGKKQSRGRGMSM